MYEVICAVCARCVVGTHSTRRGADRLATSHANAYQHNVWVAKS